MSKWVLDSISTARVYAIGSATNARVYAIGSASRSLIRVPSELATFHSSSDAGFLMLDKLELVGFNYYYASAYAIGS